MKFKELSAEAQKKACEDYIAGWLWTHEGEEMSMAEARRLCDEDHMIYDEQGNCLEG